MGTEKNGVALRQGVSDGTAFNDGCYPAAEFCEENHIPENAPAMREGSWKRY